MAPTVGMLIRVAARHKIGGVDDCVNVFAFRVTAVAASDPDGQLLMQDLSNKLRTAYATIASLMQTYTTAFDISAARLGTTEVYGSTAWGGTYAGGTATGEGLPSGVSCLVLWRTLVARTIGKTYLPPFSEASQAGDAWVAGTLTAVNSWITSMRLTTALPNGYAFQLVVHKRSIGTAVDIVNGQPQIRPAYQRRRKAGVGS